MKNIFKKSFVVMFVLAFLFGGVLSVNKAEAAAGYTSLFDFSVANGQIPYSSPVQATDGMLYGMTRLGGANSMGVIYQYDSVKNTYTKELDFAGATNGSNPYGSLVQASDGMLYGMTQLGGANGAGVIFQYNPKTNTLVKKFDFSATNGINPMGSLMKASDGMLYGAAPGGGANGVGVLFQYNPTTSTYTKKLDFAGTTNGSYPGDLMQASDGMFYATTGAGGTANKGVFYQYNPVTNIYTKKFDFTGTANGSSPSYYSLMQASDGMLYGVTPGGGANGYGFGVLYQYNPATSIYTKKIDFSAANGSAPYGSLLQAADGMLYGVTYSGGTNDTGVLYQFNLATNTYTKEVDFTDTNGSTPYSALIQASNGMLYGVTRMGGANGVGVLFQYDISVPMIGTGTIADPFMVTSCPQLQSMNANLSASYKLANNIDCSSTSGWNSGAGFVPVGNSITAFTGTFNGNGKKITGLYINIPSTNYVGLFGNENSVAEISNVGLEGENITGHYFVGGLAGYSLGSISNSYTKGNIIGNLSVGGVVGEPDAGLISSSYSNAIVTGSSNGVGGFAGVNGAATISNSYSTGNIIGNGAANVGGFAGYNNGTITNSYSTGSVSGSSASTGGFVGYSVGPLTGLSNSFWDTVTSGRAIGCGFGSTNCANLIGETSTLLMKTQSTFTGWDFASIWDINSVTNSGYPFINLRTPTLPFITRWKTDNAGTSASNQITIPTTGAGYNYSVNWGDATTSTGVTGNITHTYATPGTYPVSISGAFPRIFFNNGGDIKKILSVDQWGSIAWTSMNSAFAGATNLVINAKDVPNLSSVTDMSNMFANDTSFNQSLNLWNVSSVINMSNMFANDTSFNQPLNSWNVSNVSDMNNMFYNTIFNQPLNSWNVSSVTNMSNMFQFSPAFNQDISSWNVSSVTNMYNMFGGDTSFNQSLKSWNVSKVTNMAYMFANDFAFNQPLNSWNVSKVTDMTGMFNYAIAFNQDISSWNVSTVTNMSAMFYGVTKFSTVNYDALLASWSLESLKSNVPFDAGGSRYCSSATQRTSIISTYHWTITDGGILCPDTIAPTGSFTINNNSAYTNTTAVTLNLFAADNIGVTGYFVSETPAVPPITMPAWVTITPTTNFSADVNYNLSSGDGLKTIYVWYKDAAGNISGTATGSSTTILDTVNPTTNISSQLDNSYSNSTNINLSGTSSDANLVSTMISVDGGAFVATSGTASAWTYSATSLSEGAHTFQSQATDALGNITLSSLVHITVDITVPVSTTAPAPLNPNGTNGWYNSDVTVTFSATDNYTINQIKYCVDKVNICTPSTILNAVTGMSITVSNEGTNYVRYFSSDLAGNIEDVNVNMVSIDKTAPSAPVIYSNLAPFSNQDNVTVTWRTSNDLTSGISYYEVSRCEVAGSTSSCTPATRLNTDDIAITGYDDLSVKNDNTQYFYLVKAFDMAGNQSTVSNTVSTVIDKSGPLPPTLSAISPTGFISSIPSFLTWSAAQDPNILASGLDFYRLLKDTSVGSTLVYVTNLGNVTSYSDSTLAEGTRYYYKVRGVDKVANEGVNSNERSVVLDQTKPTTTLSTNPTSPDGTNGWYKNPLSFSLDCADLGSGETSGCQAGSTKYSINGGASTVYTAPVLIDKDGTYTITYSSVDNVGNTEDQKSQVIKLDQTAPAVAISSPTNGTLTNQNSIAVAWTIDGVAQTTQLTENLANEGSNTITRSSTDDAGNVGIASVTMTRDTTAPDNTITSSPTNPSTLTAASFAFTSSDVNATFECSLDGSVFAGCSSPQGYTGLSIGSHTFAVRATDVAGNVNQTPATYTWNITVVQNKDTDGDGVPDNVDLCPTVPGKVYKGCPFSDITVVTTHITGANSTGDCGVDKKGKNINECTIPTVGAIVKVFNRDNISFIKGHGKDQPKKNSFNSIFESSTGLFTSCTTDSTGTCQVGEDHVGKYIVIAKVTDGSKVSYDGKYKDFKTKNRGGDDANKDDPDSDNKPAKIQYFTITKNIKFQKVINNNTTKYTSEAGDSFPDSSNQGNQGNQNNNQGNQGNQNNNQGNNKGGKVSVAPQATSLWSAVKVALNNPSNNDEITVAVKAVAQKNDIAIPEWGISGKTNSRTLSASILNALDLSFLSGLFQ